MIKAYKGFNKDLTCTMGKGSFQYTENEWVEESEANCGRDGLHCCYNPLDCLNYYGGFDRSVYYLVVADGDIHEDGVNTRISCTRIKLIKRLSVEEFVAHSIMYMVKHPYLKANSNVQMDAASGISHYGFWIVRGKNPVCAAPIGTVVGMAQEAAESKEIISVTVYRVDGKKYFPDHTYFGDGREAKEAVG